jgi:hypothetical protein
LQSRYSAGAFLADPTQQGSEFSRRLGKIWNHKKRSATAAAWYLQMWGLVFVQIDDRNIAFSLGLKKRGKKLQLLNEKQDVAKQTIMFLLISQTRMLLFDYCFCCVETVIPSRFFRKHTIL